MRTTVNIDAALLADAKQVAARSHRSLGSVLEDALRQLLSTAGSAAGDEMVALPVHGRGGLRPWLDLDNRKQVADLLGDNESPRAPA